MKVLVTGVAGFIGYHVAIKLLARGDSVVGVDNLNDYYDVSLKDARLESIHAHPNAKNFHFVKQNIADTLSLLALFEKHQLERVVHLAAQAGVIHYKMHMLMCKATLSVLLILSRLVGIME